MIVARSTTLVVRYCAEDGRPALDTVEDDSPTQRDVLLRDELHGLLAHDPPDEGGHLWQFTSTGTCSEKEPKWESDDGPTKP
jgi:hypothetical protein